MYIIMPGEREKQKLTQLQFQRKIIEAYSCASSEDTTQKVMILTELDAEIASLATKIKDRENKESCTGATQ